MEAFRSNSREMQLRFTLWHLEDSLASLLFVSLFMKSSFSFLLHQNWSLKWNYFGNFPNSRRQEALTFKFPSSQECPDSELSRKFSRIPATRENSSLHDGKIKEIICLLLLHFIFNISSEIKRDVKSSLFNYKCQIKANLHRCQASRRLYECDVGGKSVISILMSFFWASTGNSSVMCASTWKSREL